MADKFNYASAPPTATMGTVGLDWLGVRSFAEKSIKLLQEQGATFLDMIDAGFRAFRAVTGRDYLAVFTELEAVSVDVQKLIDAIRVEFALT